LYIIIECKIQLGNKAVLPAKRLASGVGVVKYEKKHIMYIRLVTLKKKHYTFITYVHTAYIHIFENIVYNWSCLCSQKPHLLWSYMMHNRYKTRRVIDGPLPFSIKIIFNNKKKLYHNMFETTTKVIIIHVISFLGFNYNYWYDSYGRN